MQLYKKNPSRNYTCKLSRKYIREERPEILFYYKLVKILKPLNELPEFLPQQLLH